MILGTKLDRLINKLDFWSSGEGPDGVGEGTSGGNTGGNTGGDTGGNSGNSGIGGGNNVGVGPGASDPSNAGSNNSAGTTGTTGTTGGTSGVTGGRANDPNVGGFGKHGPTGGFNDSNPGFGGFQGTGAQSDAAGNPGTPGEGITGIGNTTGLQDMAEDLGFDSTKGLLGRVDAFGVIGDVSTNAIAEASIANSPYGKALAIGKFGFSVLGTALGFGLLGKVATAATLGYLGYQHAKASQTPNQVASLADMAKAATNSSMTDRAMGFIGKAMGDMKGPSSNTGKSGIGTDNGLSDGQGADEFYKGGNTKAKT